MLTKHQHKWVWGTGITWQRPTLGGQHMEAALLLPNYDGHGDSVLAMAKVK